MSDSLVKQLIPAQEGYRVVIAHRHASEHAYPDVRPVLAWAVIEGWEAGRLGSAVVPVYPNANPAEGESLNYADPFDEDYLREVCAILSPEDRCMTREKYQDECDWLRKLYAEYEEGLRADDN